MYRNFPNSKVRSNTQINYGYAFVEVVIALAIVLIVLSVLITGTVNSLKGSNFATAKSTATAYAKEGLELARRQRDLDWWTFTNTMANKTWCVNKAGVWSEGPNCAMNLDNIYTRSIALSWNAGTNTMTVTSKVTWIEGGQTRQSEIKSLLTKWR